MKRAKQAQGIINEVNDYLKKNHVKDVSDPVFCVVSHALIQEKIYNGFNLYNAEGKLSGGINTDYIQLY